MFTLTFEVWLHWNILVHEEVLFEILFRDASDPYHLLNILRYGEECSCGSEAALKKERENIVYLVVWETLIFQ